jgi:hypothetical protein
MHRAPTTFFALSTGQGPVRPVQAPRLTKAKARRAGRALLAGRAGRAVLAGVTLRSLETLRPLGTVEQRAAREVAPLQRTVLDLGRADRVPLRSSMRRPRSFQLFRPDAVGGQSDRCVGRTAERDEHAERCHHVRVAEVSSDAIRMHGVRLTHPEKPYKGRPPDRWRISDGLSAGYWAGEVAGERGAGPAHVHGDAGTGRRRSCRRSGTPRSHVPRLPRRGPGVSLARRISRG